MRGSDGPERLLIVASAVLFCAFAVLGFVAVSVYGLPTPGADAATYTARTSAVGIFATNALVLLGVLAGVLTFGTLSVAFLALNGAYMGAVAAYGVRAGVGPVELAALLVPHGVFEFTGFWVAGAVGLSAPVYLLGYLRGETDVLLPPERVRRWLVYSAMSLALVAVGAVVEAYVTVPLARSV